MINNTLLVLLLLSFVVDTVHSECLGTVQEFAQKFSKPATVASMFKTEEKKLAAMGDWQGKELEDGTFTWESQNSVGTVQYRLNGSSSSCVESLNVSSRTEPNRLIPHWNVLLSMNLAARAAGASKQTALELSTNLARQLGKDRHSVEMTLDGIHVRIQRITDREERFSYTLWREK